MFHKIEEVIPIKDMTLMVKFINGEMKIYDIKPLMKKWKIFEELKEEKLFEQVKVDKGGYGISWNENIDLDCNELWSNGSLVQ